MNNIFIKKSYTKCGRETISRPFSKKSKLNISLDRHVNLRAIEVKGNQAADHLLLPYVKLFYKIKRSLVLVSLSHFLHVFWRKAFLLLYSIS